MLGQGQTSACNALFADKTRFKRDNELCDNEFRCNEYIEGNCVNKSCAGTVEFSYDLIKLMNLAII